MARSEAYAESITETILNVFDRFEDRAAETRARSIYLTQIGYISMKTVEPLEYRLKFIPEDLKIFTGLEPEPEPRELERFFSRHQLVRPTG
ncbi:hypothetical protein AR540_17535 [Pseudomonas sp. EpS/L25]|nr:hypothetical protein AR540_17535 [Pseudomonas sp. EpS/L25]